MKKTATKHAHKSFWLSPVDLDCPKMHAVLSLLGVTTVAVQLFLVIRMSYLVGELANLA